MPDRTFDAGYRDLRTEDALERRSFRRITRTGTGAMGADGGDSRRIELRVVERAPHAQLGTHTVGRRSIEIERVLARTEPDDLTEDRRTTRDRRIARFEHEGTAAFGECESAPHAVERFTRTARRFAGEIDGECLQPCEAERVVRG